jgi:hypothetical protein
MRKRVKSVGPKEGDLRVWNIINVPGPGTHYPVKSVEHGVLLIDCLAESQLLQPEVGSNVFGLEVYHNGEWEDWYSEDGEELDEWAESNKVGMKYTMQSKGISRIMAKVAEE